MRNGIVRYPALAVELPEKDALLRLGYHLYRTEVSPEQRSFLRTCMCAAFSACRPQGRYEILPIESNDGRRIVCRGGFVVESGDFCGRFPAAKGLWIASATVGSAVGKEIARLSGAGALAEAAIYDAVASESADAALDFLQRLTAQELRKDGLFLMPRRFSPGYGDMALAHQRGIFAQLKLDEMGLRLTDNDFFVPEKSVSAFGAIQENANDEEK